MSRAHKALAILVVSTLGLWGCAKGPGSTSQERIRGLEGKVSRLEGDLKVAETTRDQLRKKLAAAEEHLAKLAMSDPELLLAGLEARADWQATSGLDSRTYALVKVASLIALDAPPASYLWQVANAVAAGCTPADLLGVLIAVAPQVGGPRTVAAAPELMVALGLTLPAEVDG